VYSVKYLVIQWAFYLIEIFRCYMGVVFCSLPQSFFVKERWFNGCSALGWSIV